MPMNQSPFLPTWCIRDAAVNWCPKPCNPALLMEWREEKPSSRSLGWARPSFSMGPSEVQIWTSLWLRFMYSFCWCHTKVIKQSDEQKHCNHLPKDHNIFHSTNSLVQGPWVLYQPERTEAQLQTCQISPLHEGEYLCKYLPIIVCKRCK